MLQQMQEKVTEEGKREKQLFDQFMCYCKTGQKDLQNAIEAAESKLPQVGSGAQQAISLKDQLEKELIQHRKDKEDASATVAQATALREKEARAAAQESSDLRSNIEAIGKALAALAKGTQGSFLQTSAASRLQRLTIDADMSSSDRDLLSAFLSAGDAAPSGEIIGVLKQLKESLEKNLADTVATEQTRIKGHQDMMAAKEQEMAATQQAIESKLERVGQLGVAIVNMEGDERDSASSLEKNREFLADLSRTCTSKKVEWEARSSARGEELLALAETIKLLNDDEAQDLFKKTLPSQSLLQLQVSSKEMQRAAMRTLTASKYADPRVDLILLKLRHHGGNFESIMKMIDEMVRVLKKEQADDEAKKDYCEKEIRKAEDEKKGLDQSAEDMQKSITEAKGSLEALAQELAALGQGIADLDKQVSEATGTRKEENEDFVQLLQSNNAAKELLEVAKNRLAKFYTPKLFKEAPKQELGAQERVYRNLGGALLQDGVEEEAPSLLQTALRRTASASHHRGRQPGPAPETWDGQYQAQGESQTGVIAMLNMLQADLDKETQEATVDEKHAQAAYERFIRDSASKRASDAKSIADKEGTKAELEVQIQKLLAEHKSTVSEAAAKAEFLRDLHSECDWLLGNFKVRKEARTGEVESLNRAKAVLSGADYSLLQVSSKQGRGPRRHLRDA